MAAACGALEDRFCGEDRESGFALPGFVVPVRNLRGAVGNTDLELRGKIWLGIEYLKFVFY